MIPQATLTAVLDGIDLDATFAGFLALGDPDGRGNRNALCCFHDDSRPSLSISPNGLAYCFACGWGGNAYAIIQQVAGFSFMRAVEHVADKSGIPLVYEGSEAALPKEQTDRLYALNRAAADYYSDNLLLPSAHAAQDLLRSRKFDVEDAIDAFGCGYAENDFRAATEHLTAQGFTEDEVVLAGIAKEKDGRVYDRFRGRLMWPIINAQGNVLGFGGRTVISDAAKFLNPTETPIYRKRDAFYGVDLAREAIREAEQVIIVEGYMDVMACHAAGIHNVVASNGTAFGGDHARALTPLAVSRGKWGEVVLATDSDAAGRKAAERAFAALAGAGAINISGLTYPDGMDACDVWVQQGPEALRGLLEARQPMPQVIIDRHQAPATDPVARSYAVAEVRPLLAAIEDPVVRDHWVKQAARAFSCPVTAFTHHQTAPAVAEPRPGDSENDRAEWTMCGMAVQRGIETVAALDLDWMTVDTCRDLIAAMRSGADADEVALAKATTYPLPSPADADAYIGALITNRRRAHIQSTMDAAMDRLRNGRDLSPEARQELMESLRTLRASRDS